MSKEANKLQIDAKNTTPSSATRRLNSQALNSSRITQANTSNNSSNTQEKASNTLIAGNTASNNPQEFVQIPPPSYDSIDQSQSIFPDPNLPRETVSENLSQNSETRDNLDETEVNFEKIKYSGQGNPEVNQNNSQQPPVESDKNQADQRIKNQSIKQ